MSGTDDGARTGFNPPRQRRSVASPSGRPHGVAVLSVLWALSALLNFLSGSLAALFPEAFSLALGPVGEAIARLSGGIILLAVIQVATGVGLWLVKPWARTAAIAFALAGLVNFPVGTVMGFVLLTYLFTPQVRWAFKEGHAASRAA